MMSGTVDASFDSSTLAIPQIKAGKVRAIGVTSAKRIEALPNTPAVAEVLPGFEADSWQGLLVRTGTAPDIIARLATESQKIIESEDFREKLRGAGLVP